jgi:hypothetical protein
MPDRLGGVLCIKGPKSRKDIEKCKQFSDGTKAPVGFSRRAQNPPTSRVQSSACGMPGPRNLEGVRPPRGTTRPAGPNHSLVLVVCSN